MISGEPIVEECDAIGDANSDPNVFVLYVYAVLNKSLLKMPPRQVCLRNTSYAMVSVSTNQKLKAPIITEQVIKTQLRSQIR